MRYFLRTEANCLVTLPGDDDPQRFVEQGTVLELNEASPADARIAEALAQFTHGWVEVDDDGEAVPGSEPEPLWTPPEDTLVDPVPAGAEDDEPPSVDSEPT